MKTTTMVFAVALMLTSVATAQDGGRARVILSVPGDTAEAGAAAQVIEAANAIVAAFGRHDVEAYFALFDADATFIFYSTPKRLESRAAYRQEWAAWEKDLGFRVRSCRSTNQRVQLFGNFAVFTHSVRTEITTKDGPSTLDERETIVFQRRDGEWIAVHEHLSPQAQDSPSTTGS